MALEPGSKLGSYEILGLLGAGGMGEVYRARDTTLERVVALKILPQRSSGHPQRLSRFEREAKALAALNHPGIAAIHGLELAGSIRFIVLEYVPGESLQQMTERRRLTVKEALRICEHVATALAAAHERGIIHRDLFFLHGPRMMVTSVSTEPTFRSEPPRVLFEAGFALARSSAPYHVTSDGRFVAVVEDERAPEQIVWIPDFAEELEARFREAQ